MARIDTQLKFRVPAELKGKLEEAAARNKRSLNAEIVARLEGSFGENGGHFADARDAKLAELEDRLNRHNEALEYHRHLLDMLSEKK